MLHNMPVWWIYENQRQTVHHSQNKWNSTLVIQVQSNTRVQSFRWHGLHPQMEKKSFDALACTDAPALAGRGGPSLPGSARRPTRDRKRPRGWFAKQGGRVVSVGRRRRRRRRSVPPSVRASGAFSALWAGCVWCCTASFSYCWEWATCDESPDDLGSGQVGRWGVANFYWTILFASCRRAWIFCKDPTLSEAGDGGGRSHGSDTEQPGQRWRRRGAEMAALSGGHFNLKVGHKQIETHSRHYRTKL
jgi:hypothetical protein